jgi:hypothetical protein
MSDAPKERFRKRTRVARLSEAVGLTSDGIEPSRDVEELPDSQDEGSGIGAAQGHGTFQHPSTMQFRRQGKKRRKPNPETDDVNNLPPIPDPAPKNVAVAHGGGDLGPLSQHVPLSSSSSSRLASLPSRATEDGIRQRTTGAYFEEGFSAAGDRASSSSSTMPPSSVQRGEGSFSPETDPPPSSRGSTSLGRVEADRPDILSERGPYPYRRHLSNTGGGRSSSLVSSSHQELRSARSYPVLQYPDQPSHRPFEGGSVWSNVRVRYQGVEKLLAFYVGMTLDAVNECLCSAFGLSHSRVIGLQAVVPQRRQLSNTPHSGSGNEVQSRNSPGRGGGSSSSLETRDSDIASWLSKVESILEGRQLRKGGGLTEHTLPLSSPLTMEVCRTASTVPLSDWMTACGIEKEVLLRCSVMVWCGVHMFSPWSLLEVLFTTCCFPSTHTLTSARQDQTRPGLDLVLDKTWTRPDKT